VIANS